MVSAVIPVVTQAAVGAGHWAAGRRRRALAAWASAAGDGLVAWGLGTEAPTRAEAQKNPRRLTVLAIANEALTTWTCVPRVAWAVQRRRPRIAAGSALVVAGAVARLRAAAAEPLR